MATTPSASDCATTTATACLAARGRPDPSSLDTRTLMAAFRPMNTIASHPLRFMQIDTDPTAISGPSSRWPASTTSAAMYQTSRQSMTAEASESLAKAHRPALPAMSSPAPSHHVGHLRGGDGPRRHVVGRRGAAEAPAEDGDEERQHAHVGRQRRHADPRERGHLPLRLEELLRGESEREGEHLRQEPRREVAGERGDGGVLAEQAEDGAGEGVERREEERGGGEDEARALRVDAEAWPQSVSSALDMPRRKPKEKVDTAERPSAAAESSRLPRRAAKSCVAEFTP
nr:unnamed protein product [Digitaria exilis]